ncbi:MAG TPA: M28 family peptidase [Vicinamibacteria bacterium]|nr:M28 family peptidase [Vicinamibacteria bacterium]
MRLRWPSRRGILRRLAVAGLVVAWFGVATTIERRRLHATLPGGTREATSVDVGQLVEDVRRLSAPDMEGRRTGTDGNARARAYVVQRLRDEGAAPLGGGYEHPFEFRHTSVRAIWRRDRPVRMDMRGTNVLALIPGSAPGPALVVSAHYDHLGIRGDALYPGADDNASGVGALLAVARELHGRPPRHPVILAVFDAEELGLRGSQAFVAAPPTGTPPMGMDLNLDMLSRSEGADLTVSGIGPEPWLRPAVEAEAARSPIHVHLGHDRPWYRAGMVEDWTDGSDHGAFAGAGIPWLYLGVEDHPDYHAPTDTFERIDRAFYADVASLVVSLVSRLDQDLDAIAAHRRR